MQELKIVHKDLKLDNIMIDTEIKSPLLLSTDRFDVILLDFGIARDVKASRSSSGNFRYKC